MHEQSLVKSLLRQLQALTDDFPNGQVSAIRVRVGEFSGVEPELLFTAYSSLAANSRFSNTSLVVERTQLQATCGKCDGKFPIQRFSYRCPHCGNRELSIRGGEELMLESITLEEPDR